MPSQRIAVIVCTIGRPDCVEDLVPLLAGQTRQADRVLFVVSRPEDVPAGMGTDPETAFGPNTRAETLISPKGLPRQRNRGLDAIAGDCDIAVFFDDDFLPSRYALEGIARAFAEWPEVNGMTGTLIDDGIQGTGIDADAARRRVAEHDAETAPPGERKLTVVRSGLEGLYGCNMAYRMSAVGDRRFDERLPLYAWQEDIDFAAQIPGGRIKTDAFSGLHRGAKSGRDTAGERLGYSQIANPWYLWRKGTMSAGFALNLACRNLAANHAKIVRPEPWIDRAARARGNRRGLLHILTGRSDPEHILSMQVSATSPK